MGQALTKKNVTIWIADKDTNGLDVVDGDKIEGIITSYDQTGGNVEVEYRDVFSGKVKTITSREDFEVSFDFVSNDLQEKDLHKFFMGEESSGAYVSSKYPDSYAIFIEVSTDSGAITYAYNDATNISFEPSQAADDVREGTLSFTVGAVTPSGKANVIWQDVPVENIINWGDA